MKHTKETEQAALKYALRYELNIVRFACAFGNWLAYNVSSDALEGTFSGYPHYVFVREDLKCRFADHDEVMEIMKFVSENI